MHAGDERRPARIDDSVRRQVRRLVVQVRLGDHPVRAAGERHRRLQRGGENRAHVVSFDHGLLHLRHRGAQREATALRALGVDQRRDVVIDGAEAAQRAVVVGE